MTPRAFNWDLSPTTDAIGEALGAAHAKFMPPTKGYNNSGYNRNPQTVRPTVKRVKKKIHRPTAEHSSTAPQFRLRLTSESLMSEQLLSKMTVSCGLNRPEPLDDDVE